MFGLFKSKQQREDKNELECLVEIAQQYKGGKHGVTREYVMRCYNDYMTRGAYSRNNTPNTSAVLATIRADIEWGDSMQGIDPSIRSVLKTFSN
jgi:hypothetical protein